MCAAPGVSLRRMNKLRLWEGVIWGRHTPIPTHPRAQTMLRQLVVFSAAFSARAAAAHVAPAVSTDLRMRHLGSSKLLVTEACLGTMTWGVQNGEAEAHAQLDYAIKERGVNFVDTAELYPVPLTAPEWKAGRTEEFIGTWLAANKEFVCSDQNSAP